MRESLTQAQIRQDAASERIQGVSAAARIDDPRAELLTAVLDTLMRDSDVNVRLASRGRWSGSGSVRPFGRASSERSGARNHPL